MLQNAPEFYHVMVPEAGKVEKVNGKDGKPSRTYVEAYFNVGTIYPAPYQLTIDEGQPIPGPGFYLLAAESFRLHQNQVTLGYRPKLIAVQAQAVKNTKAS